MRVKCIRTIVVDQMISKSGKSQKMIDFTDDVKINEVYKVYAILKSPYSTRFLLYVNDYLEFIEEDCFEIIDNEYDDNWISKVFEYPEEKWEIIGYPLIVNDEDHFDKIFEWSKDAIKQFLDLHDISNGN